jgi:hypothetical protein
MEARSRAEASRGILCFPTASTRLATEISNNFGDMLLLVAEAAAPYKRNGRPIPNQSNSRIVWDRQRRVSLFSAVAMF